jgi:hypothetical protein
VRYRSIPTPGSRNNTDPVRFLIFALCVGSAFCDLSAQSPAWQPSPGHTQLPIWPGTAPDPQPVAGPETVKTTGQKELVAGKPWTYVSNVTRPTMTVYSPMGRNTGAAVVVFPGGGYQILAIDLEGTEVTGWPQLVETWLGTIGMLSG